MKNEYTKLGNLFCPLLSARFAINKYTDPDEVMNDEEFKADALMQSSDIPFGIIDCVKVNKEYKDLYQVLEVVELQNPLALEMIEFIFTSYYLVYAIKEYWIGQDLLIEEKTKQQKNDLIRAKYKDNISLENFKISTAFNCI